MIGHPESERLSKGLAENDAAKKRPPLKEVWWADLNALGKNAAVAEVFGLNPRENWLSLDNLVRPSRIKKMRVSFSSRYGEFLAEARTIGAGGSGCIQPEPGEALAVAMLMMRGVVVHLEKKPLSAQASTGKEAL